MIQFIIGIVVFLAIAGVKAQKAKQNTAGGENFPFPKPPKSDPFEDWLGRTKTDPEQAAANEYDGVHNIPVHRAYQAVDEVVFSKGGTYVPVESSLKKAVRPKVRIQTEEFQFDAQQAIIYSEIMRPKFDL